MKHSRTGLFVGLIYEKQLALLEEKLNEVWIEETCGVCEEEKIDELSLFLKKIAPGSTFNLENIPESILLVYNWAPPSSYNLYYLGEYTYWHYYMLRDNEGLEAFFAIRHSGDFRPMNELPSEILRTWRYEIVGFMENDSIEGLFWSKK